MVSSESAPYVKTGGLGDVVHSLAKALVKLGNQVWIIMPFYKKIKASLQKVKESLSITFDGSPKKFDLYTDIKDGVTYYFIGYDPYYNRDYVYADPRGCYEDNHLRFGFLSLAALEVVRQQKIESDVFHIHDWHTSLLPLYKKLYYQELERVPTVLTLHNAMHQGIFDSHVLNSLHIPWEFFRPFDGIEFYGKVNFLKAGIVYCDVLTTVSPTHAEELKEYAFGLEGVIRQKKYFVGILNGIDYEVWNPEEDPYLKWHYGKKNFRKGKRANKKDIKDVFGLNTPLTRPLVGMVSRLTAQKGFDLLLKATDELVKEGFDFIVLGSGEEYYQNNLLDLMRRHPNHFRVRIDYSEELAHRIFAGADILLMPSLFEPCGVSQMIAMRYGTVPVVRGVGGLRDTVKDVVEDPQTGNGFVFYDFSPKEMVYALLRARAIYDMSVCDGDLTWFEIIKRCMKKDFSWEKGAREYERVYATALMVRRYDS